MIEGKFAERARLERRRTLRRIALGVLIVTVLVVGGWLVWFSSVLAVHQVRVQGLTTMTAQQVERTANVPMRTPLARLDLDAISARVAAMPRVADVHVSRSWPRGVTIDVVERRAVVWTRKGGTIRAVDRTGTDFRSYRKAPDGLVEAVLTGAGTGPREDALTAIAAVAHQIRQSDGALASQITSFAAGSKDSVELRLTKGRTVVWGSKALGERKLEVLRALLGIKAKKYDVSAPDQPTTTP
jgi:cell division protein FtsQ